MSLFPDVSCCRATADNVPFAEHDRIGGGTDADKIGAARRSVFFKFRTAADGAGDADAAGMRRK